MFNIIKSFLKLSKMIVLFDFQSFQLHKYHQLVTHQVK